MVHLCTKHQEEWDETPESTILALTRTITAKTNDKRQRCINSDCRALINYPRFHLCVYCAEKNRQCQQCSASTLTEEEKRIEQRKAEREEAHQRAIDLYTLAVKTYGISSARTLLMQESKWGAELLNSVLCLGHRELDYGREMRPIWRLVLGADVYRNRFCSQCPPVPRQTPSLTRGDLCQHLTVGQFATYCPLCAADAHACERCGEPA